ncbi:MAG: hypothetical protein K9N09_04290 [Candidatus Cloacimonetes bacterium]|nr:hypothetical protein [Candidatus Cloacimonadota bacterium]MCF7814843.1 hypothetical protein [Candidatus Cloacimonadota bacterium]MCF7867899.1 hypothetical protein [Candidatus Cloacimonadota bacterium]MCF7883718.1 hypothetical protein [Candidatus Cloacimonadota bacterium]
MKRNLTFLLSALIILMFAFGCSEKDSTGNDNDDPTPPEIAQTPDLEMTFPDSADLVDFVGEDVDYEGEIVTGYNLVQFLDFDRDGVDELEYTYEITSDDGYSPRQGGNPDLYFSQFETGYLLPTEKFRTYFPSDEIFTAYDVKYALQINLYRAVIVIDADGNEITFQTGAFETEDVYHESGNGNFYTDPGFELDYFISKYVTENPENYEYHFTASDDYTKEYTWEDIQTGYWLTTQNKAVFIDAEGNELQNSFKYLIRIELVALS